MILFKRNAEIIGLEFILEFIDFSVSDFLISCDQERIQQVCLNLLSNAFKFTEKGFIKIQVKKKNDNQLIEISVHDTGVGISKENQQQLFKVFGFITDSQHMNTKGIGLGLVISERIVTMFNGTITLESELGVGTKFIATFEIT